MKQQMLKTVANLVLLQLSRYQDTVLAFFELIVLLVVSFAVHSDHYTFTFIPFALQFGDVIDARDETMGAWFEADLVRVEKVAATNGHSVAAGAADDKSVDSNDNVEVKSAKDYPDGFIYYVNFEGYDV